MLERVRTALCDRYTVEREIGAGGMAVVFLAHDMKLGRRVAVKVLRPELAATLGPERFLREITLAAGLQHPHNVAVHDSDEREGLLYYVMPFVEGESLRERLRREGRLPGTEALNITRGVAAALGYAHRRGVLHRDVKPENILLSGDEALVTDFGIAKAVSAAADATLTQAGVAIGTPAYMSPEQIAGEPDLDGRSDIFSLGCVLYEMLCGEPPFTGANAQAVMAKRFVQAPPSLRSQPHVTPVPDTVVRAVTRALASVPTERFATVAEFTAALDAPGTTLPPRSRTGPSIAVLPFTNISADPENEYFSDGISEEIINALTRVPALRVAARTSSFAFKGKREDVRTIGERLNVGTVLEGSVRRAGPRLRITAQLTDVGDGYHLWGETYERELHDVFAIQDEIARAIVETLKVKLLTGAEALVNPPTEHVEAYALYLKGRHYWSKRIESALIKGLECFERAIAIDPQYALAHVGLADSYNILGYYDLRAPRECFPRAHDAARFALALEPTLAPAHAAEGYALMYHEWDFAEAERCLRRAIELDPRYAIAHFYLGNLLTIVGRIDEAIAMMRRAIEIEPLSLIVNAAIGWCLSMARRTDQALTQYDVALDLDDRFLIARWWKGMTLADRGELAGSAEELERVVATSRTPTMLASLARTHALARDTAKARALLSELDDLATRRYVSSFELAVVRDALGEREKALTLLEAAYAERSHSMAFLAVDPRLDALRAEPRVAALRRLVGV